MLPKPLVVESFISVSLSQFLIVSSNDFLSRLLGRTDYEVSQKFMPLILNCESADINATEKLAFSPLQPTEHSSWTSTWSFTTALAVGIIMTSGVGAGHPHQPGPKKQHDRPMDTNMDSDSRTDHKHLYSLDTSNMGQGHQHDLQLQ